MQYNIDFLIAALAFVVVVLPFYFVGHNRTSSVHSITFACFLCVGALNITLDIVTSIMYAYALAFPLVLLHIVTTLFFLLQCAVPLILFMYLYALTNDVGREHITFLALGSAPFLAMVMLIATNPFTGILFTFDPVTRQYAHGYGYILMFAQAFFYGILGLIYLFAKRDELRRIEVMAIASFVVLIFFMSFLQSLFPDVLLTGLGIGLGIIVFMVALSNPFDMTDPLTGTLELGVFSRRIKSLISRNQPFGVVFISIDNMRVLNNLSGRSFGDSALRACANDLAHISKDGRVYRLKGTRFAILTDSMRETRRVHADIESYFEIEHYVDGRMVKIDASIWRIEDGARVSSSEEMQGYMEYLVASMRNKELSNFSASNDLESYRRYHSVHQYLARAVEEDLFELYVQPLVDTKTNRFASCEALSRLHHPELGYIPPMEFIAIAEEEGKISQISRLQFEKICRYFRDHAEELKELGITTVKVNLSPIDLAQRDVADSIIDCINRYGLDLTQFSFEVTESCATQYGAELDLFIERVIDHGAGLYLDDFGSGFANFETLVNLPFTGVKIDRTLLNKAADNARTASLYQSIISTMQSIGLRVVSEGIEETIQNDTLRTWGVDELQGFLYARPMPIEELCIFVQNKEDVSKAVL